jgi:hypothetical protein
MISKIAYGGGPRAARIYVRACAFSFNSVPSWACGDLYWPGQSCCATHQCGCTASSTLACEREDGAHSTFSVRPGDCGRATSDDATCTFACGRGGVWRHAQWGCRGSGGCARGRTAGARVACRTVEMDRRDDGRRSRVHRCGACEHKCHITHMQ